MTAHGQPFVQLLLKRVFHIVAELVEGQAAGHEQRVDPLAHDDVVGDQILPSITTNVSTWHIEPEFDAVGAFLKTCKTFLDVLHPETLILPSHRKPFYNVQHRLKQLAAHHAQRLNVVLDAVGDESCAGALIDVMFTPGLDGHQIGFAMGEAIAHLNHLVALGHLEMVETQSQVRYRRINSKDKRVEPHFT